jgi:hypothetical protein
MKCQSSFSDDSGPYISITLPLGYPPTLMLNRFLKEDCFNFYNGFISHFHHRSFSVGFVQFVKGKLMLLILLLSLYSSSLLPFLSSVIIILSPYKNCEDVYLLLKLQFMMNICFRKILSFLLQIFSLKLFYYGKTNNLSTFIT